MNSRIVAGLDIGTTKIACIIGEVTDEGLNVIGIGSQPSEGLRKGVVINIDATVEAIQKAVEDAEVMAGCEINNIYAGIAGSHVKGVNSRGITAIEEDEVGEEDLTEVVHNASAMAMPADREKIHVIPQEYIIDNQEGIREPIGMSGVRMEANVHVVTASSSSAQNVVKCANACDLRVEDIVLEQLASSNSVLEQDEKELGVAVVDIGGGTTDIAIYNEGSLVHTSVLSVGGNHLTNDIAVGLRTPMEEAEKLKQKFGCVKTNGVDPDETIEVPSVGGRPPRVLSRQLLSEIVEPRAEEIFSYVARELESSGYYDTISSGVVITGGTTILDKMPELAEDMLDVPVRRGKPRGIGGLVDAVRNPKFSTGVGLVQYGAFEDEQPNYKSRRSRSLYGWFTDNVKDWIVEMF